MEKPSNNQRLKTYFEQAYNKKLADKEVLEYKDHLVKFFSLLIEIDQRNKRKSNEAKNIWSPNHTDKTAKRACSLCQLCIGQHLYLGSIGIMTRPQGGYRLTYPTKRVGIKDLNIFYPINKTFAKNIEKEVLAELEKVTNENDRHNSFDA